MYLKTDSLGHNEIMDGDADTPNWPGSEIPTDLANDPAVRDNAKIVAYMWNLIARESQTDARRKKDLNERVSDSKVLIDLHRRGDTRRQFQYWLMRMAAPMSPPLRAIFAKLEPSLNIPARDGDLSKPLESSAYASKPGTTVYEHLKIQ